MKRKMLYVVEMKERKNWIPTAGVGINREDARREMKQFKENDPHDKFRIRKYFSQDEIRYLHGGLGNVRPV